MFCAGSGPKNRTITCNKELWWVSQPFLSINYGWMKAKLDSFCIPNTTRFRGLERYTSMSSMIELAVLHFKISFKRFLDSIIITRKNLILLSYSGTLGMCPWYQSLENCTKMWLVSFDSMLLFQFSVALAVACSCFIFNRQLELQLPKL